MAPAGITTRLPVEAKGGSSDHSGETFEGRDVVFLHHLPLAEAVLDDVSHNVELDIGEDFLLRGCEREDGSHVT